MSEELTLVVARGVARAYRTKAKQGIDPRTLQPKQWKRPRSQKRVRLLGAEQLGHLHSSQSTATDTSSHNSSETPGSIRARTHKFVGDLKGL